MIGNLNRKLRNRLSDGDWLPICTTVGGQNAIAISFDDGPSPCTTPTILHLLARFDATAAFFLCGERAERYPSLVEDIAAQGHAIYSHGYWHQRMDEMSPDAFARDLARTEAVLARFRPTPSPYILRLPYGSGHDSARVHAQLRSWRDDVQIAHWSHSFEDWTLADNCDSHATLQIRCDDAIVTALADRGFGGSILLLHEDAIGSASALSGAIAPLLLAALLRGIARYGIKTTTISASTDCSTLSRFVRFKAVR
ncbi:polysaccharide deacetylase [Sphingomonas faeni]|uniref:Chitooligosaccharide deacetylase n=1 Tax=Sphingomonas faeni TaxID=185950 RepID=A0A2T5TY75_9SPHN|nr:polysaccharide deacetylase family protein [Sphingomonas faeni]PTW44212.1 polysaccharide deacetylase [Sphingomonas faeni]